MSHKLPRREVVILQAWQVAKPDETLCYCRSFTAWVPDTYTDIEINEVERRMAAELYVAERNMTQVSVAIFTLTE